MSEDVEVIRAMPIRHINVQIYPPEKVVTLQMTDGKIVRKAAISGETLKKLGESVLDLLEQHPEVESWEMPSTLQQPQRKSTH